MCYKQQWKLQQYANMANMLQASSAVTVNAVNEVGQTDRFISDFFVSLNVLYSLVCFIYDKTLNLSLTVRLIIRCALLCGKYSY